MKNTANKEAAEEGKRNSGGRVSRNPLVTTKKPGNTCCKIISNVSIPYSISWRMIRHSTDNQDILLYKQLHLPISKKTHKKKQMIFDKEDYNLYTCLFKFFVEKSTALENQRKAGEKN